MKKVAIGQAGGPTSVLNATLAGLTKEVMNNHSLMFIRNGYQGFAQGNFIEGKQNVLKWVIQNKHVPGACLGSGRYPLSDEEIKKSVKRFRKMSIDTFIMIGGNGTMEALHKIEKEASQTGYDLQVIGLPKTVDNDIGGTDHAPGFGTSARYIAQSTRDISRDLHAMQNFEQVRILETMGRNAGWLASASAYLRQYEEDGPHFIAIPEGAIDTLELLTTVEKAVQNYGCATIVVSEGAYWDEGNQVEREVVDGRPILGGISNEVETLLKRELNVMARSELLGMNQRCYSIDVSNTDYEEALLVGATGGRWIQSGKTGVMLALERVDQVSYNISTKPVALKEVVKEGERLMPTHFIEDCESYIKWLKPLIGDGLPSYPAPVY